MVKKNTKKKLPKKTKKRESKQRSILMRLAIKVVLALVITFALWILWCIYTMPDIEKAVERTRQPSTMIIAENGNEIHSFGNVYSEVVYLDELPPYVADAVISTEDRRFYEHFGFDIISFTRAMLVNLWHRSYVQGGSTISQQVAKNLFLTANKTIKRKVQELLLAFWLESKFTKDQILTLYLNRVYLGAGTYGIEAASQKYFQKSSRDMNLLEAAIIAGMLKAPSRYNPIASEERARERAAVVLDNMVKAEVITEEQRQNALKMKLGPEKSYKVKGARHFADWVYQDVNDYIGERDNDIYVATTLDQDIQQKAEKILHDSLKAWAVRDVTQGAIVVLDKQGAVKAMVGGVNYEKSQFNRAIQALRQPGSSFKPFVYLTALENGFYPDDVVNDSPINIRGWKPENYDKQYHGEVTLTEALKDSLNLATINLANAVGRDKIIKTARRMGISTPIENTPSMALGAFEVKVLDMAVAYASIANGGYEVWPYAIQEIYTRDGYQLYMREQDDPNQILDEDAVEELTQMLEEVLDSGTGKRAKLPFFAAGKTGTTQDYRDAWFVGFTDNYIAAVWVGNDDNSPMKGVTGGTLPAQIWKEVMLAAEN